MNLITDLFWFSLVLSGLNWLAFAVLIGIQNIPAIRALLEQAATAPPRKTGIESAELHSMDPAKMAEAIGTLATAFGKSGAAATMAALSVFFALVAAIACGIAVAA